MVPCGRSRRSLEGKVRMRASLQRRRERRIVARVYIEDIICIPWVSEGDAGVLMCWFCVKDLCPERRRIQGAVPEGGDIFADRFGSEDLAMVAFIT